MSKRGVPEFWRPSGSIKEPDFSDLEELEQNRRQAIQDLIMSQYREPPPYFDDPAFIAAIRAEPDNDTIRLVYADWLQENDQEERAAFIRASVEYDRTIQPLYVNDDVECFGCWSARIPGELVGQLCHCRPEFRKLRSEYFRLHKLVRPALLKNTPWEDVPAGEIYPTFSRGFISEGTCPSADWIRLGDATLAKHPVRRVTWTDESQFMFDMNDPQTVWFEGDLGDQRLLAPAKILAELSRSGDISANTRCQAARLRWPGVEFEIREQVESLTAAEHRRYGAQLKQARRDFGQSILRDGEAFINQITGQVAPAGSIRIEYPDAQT